MKCTWIDCSNEAIHSQKDNNGIAWANLCTIHHQEIEDCMLKFDDLNYGPRRILSSWIKAQGGAKKAASRM